jgi:hypothetical protein
MKTSRFRTRLPLATLAALAAFIPAASQAATLQGRVSEAGLAGSLQGVIVSVGPLCVVPDPGRRGERYL